MMNAQDTFDRLGTLYDGFGWTLLSWSFENRVPFDVVEVRIGTTLAAMGLAIVALKRAFSHKRLKHYDFTAVYLCTFLALVTYVFASSYVSWVGFGKGISTVREAVYVVYHLLTMVSWLLWFVITTKRGVYGARSEGR